MTRNWMSGKEILEDRDVGNNPGIGSGISSVIDLGRDSRLSSPIEPERNSGLNSGDNG